MIETALLVIIALVLVGLLVLTVLNRREAAQHRADDERRSAQLQDKLANVARGSVAIELAKVDAAMTSRMSEATAVMADNAGRVGAETTAVVRAEVTKVAEQISTEVDAVRSQVMSSTVQSERALRAEVGHAIESLGELITTSSASLERTTAALVPPRIDLSEHLDAAFPEGLDQGDLIISPTGIANEVVVIGSPSKARALGEVKGQLPHGLAKAIVGTHALLEMGIAAGQQAGVLVKLTAESAQRLKELNVIPTAGGGSFLGVLRDGSGHFAHVLQLTSVNGLQVATNVAGALTGVALQMQLASLERSIRDVSNQVRVLQESLDRIRKADERATREVLLETYRVSSETGMLTEAMWRQLAPLYHSVRKAQEHARLEVEAMIEEINQLTGSRSVKSRRLRLEDLSAGSLEAALSALHEADQMMGQYQALRLWHLVQSGDAGLVSYQHEIVRQLKEQADLASRTRIALHRAVRDVSKVNKPRQLIQPLNTKKLEAAADRMEAQLSSARAVAVERQKSLERLVPKLPPS